MHIMKRKQRAAPSVAAEQFSQRKAAGTNGSVHANGKPNKKSGRQPGRKKPSPPSGASPAKGRRFQTGRVQRTKSPFSPAKIRLWVLLYYYSNKPPK
jgi:hypothetical protein